jgi:DNA-binding NtrC family response regulator
MTMLNILIADDERAARFGMAKALAAPDCRITEAADGPAALDAIRSGTHDLVFLDLSMPGVDGQSILRELQGTKPSCDIVVVTANDSIQTAIACMKLGAVDFVTKPFEIEQLRSWTRRCARRLELERKVADLQNRLEQKHALGALIGISRPMRALFGQIERVARAPVDILIRGETGTGKELIAREIHRLSERARGPFVPVNTAAIAESLAESELFGHVRGAFTSAGADKPGRLELADGGTLLFDEIGELPPAAQVKLLRFLDTQIIERLGSVDSIRLDVRILAATNRDLESAMETGRFRQDLYYRLAVIQIVLPPLAAQAKILRSLQERVIQPVGSTRAISIDVRVVSATHQDLQRAMADGHFRSDLYFRIKGIELNVPPLRTRHEDIVLLVDHFLGRLAGRMVAVPSLSTQALDRLLTYGWPGNVRELEHALTAAATMADGPVIRPGDLHLPGSAQVHDVALFNDMMHLPLTEAKEKLVESFERARIAAALERNQDNVTAAARELGVHRQSLQQKMAQLGIRRNY